MFAPFGVWYAIDDGDGDEFAVAQHRTVFEAMNSDGSDGIKHMTYGQYVLAK